jgi:hypothetical protein
MKFVARAEALHMHERAFFFALSEHGHPARFAVVERHVEVGVRAGWQAFCDVSVKRCVVVMKPNERVFHRAARRAEVVSETSAQESEREGDQKQDRSPRLRSQRSGG